MSKNVIEVLSSGSFEIFHDTGNRPTSNARSSSQLSLEYLPPEEPSCLHVAPHPCVAETICDHDIKVDYEEEELTSEELYSRIHQLSEKIKDGLNDYQRSVGNMLQVGIKEPNDTKPFPLATLGQEATDLKLQKAIEKMLKLDIKLAELVKKEKEVKERTKLLKDTMLDPVGLENSTLEEEDSTLAVFPTQPRGLDKAQNIPAVTAAIGQDTDGKSATINMASDASTDCKTPEVVVPLQEERSHIDFVKRNIEVSGEVGGIFAMTDAEKQRLEELMSMSGEEEEEDLDSGPNGHLVHHTFTNEFIYNEQDMQRMKDIDSQLQALISQEQWRSICQAPSDGGICASEDLATESSELETHILCEEANTDQHCHKNGYLISRLEQNRIKEIDEKLQVLQNSHYEASQIPQVLSPSVLKDLLEQCMKVLRPTCTETASQCSDVMDQSTGPHSLSL